MRTIQVYKKGFKIRKVKMRGVIKHIATIQESMNHERFNSGRCRFYQKSLQVVNV